MKKIIWAAVIVFTALLFMGGPVLGVWYYDTYEVVGVTEKTFVLEHPDGEKVEIEKSRRPDLKKGDKVRYDKYRDRLGRTLDEKKE